MTTILTGVLLISLLLSGCGSKVPELSEEESMLISEYATGMLLRYDTKHQSRLVDTKKIEQERKEEEAKKQAIEEKRKAEEQNKADKEAQQQASESAQTVVPEQTYASISEFLGISEIGIQYAGYEVCEKYPQDNISFAVNAAQGKSLLVIKFNAANLTEQDITLDIFSRDLKGRVAINGEETVRILTTMLLEDMSTYQDLILAGETKELILVIETNTERLQNLSTAILTLQKQDASMDIDLLQ